MTVEVTTPEFYVGKLSPRNHFQYLNIGKLNFYKVYKEELDLKKAIDNQVEDHGVVLADKFVFDDDCITHSTKILDELDEGRSYSNESEFKDCSQIELKSPAYSLYNIITHKLTAPNGPMTFFCQSKETIRTWKIKHPKKDYLRIVRLDKVTKLIDAPSQYNLESICTSNRYLVILSNYFSSNDTKDLNISELIDAYYDKHYFDNLSIDQVKAKIFKDGWCPSKGVFNDACWMNISIEGNKVKFIKDLQ